MNRPVKFFLLSGAALTMWGGAALAADVAAPVTDWTGFYIGAGGGGAFSFSNTDASGYGIMSIDENGRLEGEGFYDFDGGFAQGYTFCENRPNREENNCSVDFGMANAMKIGDSSFSSSVLDMINEAIGTEGASDVLENGDNDSGKASAFGTIEGGFDYQIGSNFVVGINGAFNFQNTEIKNSASSGADAVIDFGGGGGNSDAEGAGFSALDAELQLGNSWSAGVRAGYLVNDRVMLFASGGYISTQAELTADYSTEGGADVDGTTEAGDPFNAEAAGRMSASSSNDEWLNGYYVGGGVETLLTDTISFKLEYRFADLGSIETSEERYSDSGNTSLDPDDINHAWAAAGVSAEADPVVHSIRATLNWRF